ncbi:H-2 class II histocompatibility antigen, A-U alpha chain-like [Pseudoliparis swirei]|uniref:H-2 class II histocompatibility antigen, A-U alpha chain-like n=1 Tax=Pseudoliparis swirei TaxID=2059687 RepID=UPI0024BE7EF7|nr:H-2 class II histocompatibility antigen, A-U alpha chain-like [Pseudoliparis swirei]XP_056300566.1 H-2 class II histocompatibility antigen, A-U alpha chain-like [Pseudoliparis swirei]
MKRSALIILMINSLCAFSQIPNEFEYVVGCFENEKTEVQYEFNGEELLYVDFDREEIVYTLPRFVTDDPSKLFENVKVFQNANKNKVACSAILTLFKAEEKSPPEEKDPPQSILYTSEEVQLEVENTLICFVNHFFPPDINVSWTRNGHLVSEGQSLSRYYPNNDHSFHQFTTLTFTPKKGDVYSCTVEHSALDRPITKSWEPEFSHPSLGPDVFCGVGLTLGLVGVAAGTFLMVKRHHGQ